MEEHATRLIDLVAAGDPESWAQAQALADAILTSELVQRATVLRTMLKEGSPFALVRALDLAERALASSSTPSWPAASRLGQVDGSAELLGDLSVPSSVRRIPIS